ncbi:MAG: hypothetical protein MUE56_03960 [Ignavibacteria bacterium]|nr:hypothetical protein [Ignavibacteria bacterium]
MKNILTAVFLFVFACTSFAQDINEKKILEVKNAQPYFIYDLKYNTQNGSYTYVSYDTTNQKSKIISNKGNSGFYDYVSSLDVVFDKPGNYYAIAYNSLGEKEGVYRYKYFLLKNGKEIGTFDNVLFPISEKNNAMYFIANEGGKDFRVKYDFQSGNFDNGQKYDTIYLSYISKELVHYEGEPQHELGFTKSGEDFYVASNNGKHFVVVGGKEMKHVDEIVYHESYEDNEGNICYIAKEIKGEEDSYYVVQGEKEYKKFMFATGPLMFDRDNLPVYSVSDINEDYPSEQYLAKGSDAYSKKYGRSVWLLDKSPDGGIVYTGSDTLADGSYVTELVVDGKPAGTGSSIWGVVFKPDGTPVFTAEGPDNTQNVVSGGKVVSKNYSSVLNLNVSKNGKIYFTGVKWGDYDKNEPNLTWFVFDGREYGPFENIMFSEIMPELLVVNDKEEPAYIATKMMQDEMKNQIIKNYVIGKGWKSGLCDYISDLTAVKNDFYYLTVNYGTDEMNSGTSQVYKNGKKIGDEYDAIKDFKIDKEKKKLSFTGSRGNTAYYCEMEI